MALARNDHELADALLSNRSEFGLPEVLKAIQLLDSGRQARVLEKKVKRMQLSGTKVNPKKLGKIKSDIDNLTALKPPVSVIEYNYKHACIVFWLIKIIINQSDECCCVVLYIVTFFF